MLGDTIFPDIKDGKIPFCPKCAAPRRTTKNSRKRKLARDGTDKKPKRRPGDYDSGSDSEYDMPTRGGIMKPDITFFGEALPDAFSRRLVDHDRYQTDLVVVIGTSLKVAPVSELVPFLPPHIPQIYVSRTPVAHHNFDIDLLGDCDVVVAELCRRAGWDLRHDMIPGDQVIDVCTEPGWASRHVFTAHSPGGGGDAAGAAAVETTTTTTDDGLESKPVKAESAAVGNGDANGTSQHHHSGGGSTASAAVTTRSGRRSGKASPR